MNAVAMSELIFVFVALLFWAVPVAVGVWVVVTLHRIRTAQEAIAARLRAIEARLPASR